MEEIVHTFYSKTSEQQRGFMWKTAAVLLIFILSILALVWWFELYWLIMIIPVVLLIMAPFIDVPAGVKAGQFVHFSPLFISSRERKGEVVVHGGTLFDYYFSLREIKPKDRKKAVILCYLKGLVRLVEKYEKEGKEMLVIKGTSYILNERTAGKVGFRLVETDLLQKMIMTFNYIPIMIGYSYIKGKISFPDLSKVITLKATVKELSSHKESLVQLMRRID